ncbi:MAG: TAT-variant-translocated molybdopterin oxidoreductase, partial [Verrucomicrobiae bacterium]|nr:TAT-variant-translocated molybdopterin oxidoreductase [Verrucomicrobiae bacterium]
MKRQWQHPEAPKSGRAYWRSLGELEDSSEFRDWLAREFPRGAAELEADDVSRRNFVKLMGAATALAGFGMSGCSRPVRNLVPFNEHVEWIVPGKALYYASAKGRLGGRGCDPLVVTTHEGRPTRVDGNRLHPSVSGGSDAFTQASILDLYDPDRSRAYRKGGVETTAAAFEAEFLAEFRKAASGQGVAFLVSPNSSPTRAALLAEVSKKYAGAKVFGYEPFGGDGLGAAEAELFGPGARVVPRFDRAERILSLDSDFLGLDKVGEDPVAEFTRGRRVDGKDAKMNRLYVVEPSFTLTGGMADHRYRLPAGQVAKAAVLLAIAVAETAGDAALAGALKPVAAKFKASVIDGEWIAECAKDLAASKGKALVVAGSRQPKEVHLLVAAMNAALGAFGGDKAVAPVLQTGEASLPGIADLAKAIEAGQVKKLFITTDADPVFDAPGDLRFGDLLSKVDMVIHHGPRQNATAAKAFWHVPAAHYLESWGDWRGVNGGYSVQQPMILPLNGGVSEIELLLSLVEAPPADGAAAPITMPGVPEPDGPVLARVKASFAAIAKGGDWFTTVRDGFAKGARYPAAAGVAVDAGKVGAALGAFVFSDVPRAEALEVALAPGAATYDGRFANNGWMQEAPDPVTKLTWDNAALMSRRTANELGLKDGDVIELTASGNTVKVPVLRAPGQADNTIQLAAGYYGKDFEPGSIAKGVGTNVWPLRTSAAPFVIGAVTLAKTAGKHDLALTSEHYSMEGRAIVREGTKGMFDENAHFAQTQGMDAHIPENVSLYQGPDYLNPDNPVNKQNAVAIGNNDFVVDPDHQWAMTIDLHACIGCNSCTVACQSENNIPIVGKDQVIRGREMHWIRMDRYFSSPYDSKTVSEMGLHFDETGKPGKRFTDDDAVEMLPQPVACQQCEAAPCETVCPVNATVHTGDGLNAMTYNRCIGTRYCANNC